MKYSRCGMSFVVSSIPFFLPLTTEERLREIWILQSREDRSAATTHNPTAKSLPYRTFHLRPNRGWAFLPLFSKPPQ